ncbi:hypothetical protein Aperf_G00000109873 [Anoplocephala perfoliata]
MAPEMCTPSNEPLTQSVDVFAFGLVAYFILTHGQHPFYSIPPDVDSNPTSSDADLSVVEKPKLSLSAIYSSLASLQAMQKAIIDQQEPNLNDLAISSPTDVEDEEAAGEEKNSDKMYSCLAKQLIQEALNFDPSVRLRDTLGTSDAEIALYWNSKFPSLLPLTYCLARVHLADVDHFRRFLPAAMTSMQAETFIRKYCAPVPPAMWSRMTASPQTSPIMVRPKVIATTEEQPFSRPTTTSSMDARKEFSNGILSPKKAENVRASGGKNPATIKLLPKMSSTHSNVVDVSCTKIKISPAKVERDQQSIFKTPPQSNFWFSPQRQKERNTNVNAKASAESTPANPPPLTNGGNREEAGDKMNDKAEEEGKDLSDGFMYQTKKKRIRKYKNVPKTH